MPYALVTDPDTPCGESSNNVCSSSKYRAVVSLHSSPHLPSALTLEAKYLYQCLRPVLRTPESLLKPSPMNLTGVLTAISMKCLNGSLISSTSVIHTSSGQSLRRKAHAFYFRSPDLAWRKHVPETCSSVEPGSMDCNQEARWRSGHALG